MTPRGLIDCVDRIKFLLMGLIDPTRLALPPQSRRKLGFLRPA
jgi:hypothetical protein